MTRVLMTAFEPYDRWPDNSSWSALIDLTRWYDGAIEITTRRYPVDLTRMSQNLRKDLQEDYDFAIHLGQSPGHPVLKLEAVGLNVRSDGSPLVENAPQAYRSTLPLDRCCRSLLAGGIPCEVSHHAGTYLCNAALFLSQHYAQSFGMRTQAVFIHIPLSPGQVATAQTTGDPATAWPSMSTPMASAAIAMILDQLGI